jgi:predicted RNase H-like nuclease
MHISCFQQFSFGTTPANDEAAFFDRTADAESHDDSSESNDHAEA